MALSSDDCKALNALFPQSDHEFTRGFVYIQERAICDRLDAVDPSWCFDIKSVQVRDSDVVVVATLSLLGCVREGVGMAKIVEKGAEAEKSAATDALKRAARLFGVGRYLLSAPEERQFAGWLAKLAKGDNLADAPVEPPRKTAPKAEPASHNPGGAEADAAAVALMKGANGWTRQEADSLVTEANTLHVTTDELLGLLGVERISQYAPGFSEAREALKRYIKARPADATPLPADLFGGNGGAA